MEAFPARRATAAPCPGVQWLGSQRGSGFEFRIPSCVLLSSHTYKELGEAGEAAGATEVCSTSREWEEGTGKIISQNPERQKKEPWLLMRMEGRPALGRPWVPPSRHQAR